jgi:3-deoxy-D-arabino-heptulosonate 7-phosphate (DAHP) synthase
MIIGPIGDEAILQSVPLEAIPGVEKVLPILKHSNPEEALCDGEQALKPKSFRLPMDELRMIAKAVGREI